MGNDDGIERPDWGPGGENRGPTPVTVYAQHSDLPSPQQVTAAIERGERPSEATHRAFADDTHSALVKGEGRSVDVAAMGFIPEVAAELSKSPDGLAAAAGHLQTTMINIWGDDAAQVAKWAEELPPRLQA